MASKASANFPSFMTGYYGPSSSSSRDFQSLVRAIGEAKSKHEEDRIAKRELALLKDKLTQRDTSPKQMREYLVRLIYCELLGHDASIGYVEAIKFAQQPNNLDKRVGYLAASLFLHEDHELIVLLINTLQKDLRSTNVIEVCCALTVVCKLINKEMMPALLPQVIELLQCKRDIVRKKAVMALQSFYLKNPSSIPDVRGHAKKAIRDKDPGVMSASLHVFHELIKANPAKYKDLVPAFVSLQNMIIGGKLASDYDFHGVAAPWIQIKVLKILGLLGVDDEKSSKAMYPILGKTLSNLNTSSLIGYAVAYEGLRTITSIYPDRSLIQKAGRCVHVFLVAKTNDIKYLGINILTSLLQAGSGFVMEPTYQRIVIDCLDDPDETLKRKTLDLLCHITNAENVDKVCEKLLSYLKSTTDADVYFRTQLVDRITELAERYAPDNSWYILTMNEVFELGGSLVRDAVAHNMMRLLAEGTDDEHEDDEIRRFAVMSYINLLEKPVLPDILIRVNSWVLGEYSYTASEYDPEYFLEELLSLLERKFEDPSTKAWVISAIGKLTSQMGHLQDSTRDVLETHATGVDVELRQRCSEIQELSQNTFLMQSVLPVDGCCEDLEVDESLSFLDGLVAEALSSGAPPYTPMSERNTEKKTKEVSDVQPALKFTPYENPIKRPREPTPQPDSTYDEKEKRSKPLKTSTDVEPKAKSRTKTKTIEETPSKTLFSGQAVWGPGGYAKDRARSGSVDSNSKSDSSSRSTGSENTAVKTNAEASTSSPVTNQDDVRKQHLAAQLFSGVTVKPRSSAGRGHLGSNKMSRHAGKTKADTAGMPSVDDSSHSLQLPNFKAADNTNTDLLCDLGSYEVRDNEEEQARFKTHALLSSLDMVASRDSNNSNIQELFADSKPPLPVPTGHADPRLSVPTSHADPRLSVPTCTGDVDPGLSIPTSHADPRLSVQTSHDPHLSVPTSQANPSYETTEQKTTLLDEEITVPLQCLELTGSPSASLPKDLAEFPHSPEALELCFDSNLRVTLQKVWKPSELVLVIYLTNQNPANTPVHDVTSVFEPPSNLIGSFDASSSNTLQDESIGGLEWVRHQIVLKYKSPALHMNFGGKISYKDPNRTLKHLFFNHTLSIRDILRPLVISTEEFGQKWTDASFEKKQKLSSSLKSCQEFSKRTEDCLKLYPVEIIGTKVILAGTVMQSGICLLHASCDGDELELSIKSNNRLLNDALLKHCGTVFR